MRKAIRTPRPGAKQHRLLDGQIVDIRGLDEAERRFLADLRKMARAGVSFFEIERTAIGSGSPALEGRNRIDERLARTALYRVAEDLATRAGIDQGLVLAPKHESVRASVPSDGSMMSVVQAAAEIGISRTAVYKAIEKGALEALHIGNVTLVARASARAYRDRRRNRGGPSDRRAKRPRKPVIKVGDTVLRRRAHGAEASTVEP